LILTAGAACSSRSAENGLTMAVAWKQTAAEYEALYHQGFNLARMKVQAALVARGPLRPPLAVIADLDDTLLDTRGYWRELIAAGGQLFDDARWDAWVATNGATASPGAADFLEFCRGFGVAVFVITNRDQGDRTAELALANIRAAGLPHIGAEQLTVLRESSDKETRQREIEASHNVIVLLGDNLNDFRRRYYVTDVDERRRLMADDRGDFGHRFILFPNPTDGHWIRAIFGDSEPPPSQEHLDRLRRVAEGR
jgi:5'-nucleotidase (lipoprotein e(P4) family)